MKPADTPDHCLNYLREVEARFQRTYSQWNPEPKQPAESSRKPTKGSAGINPVLENAANDILALISDGCLKLKDGRKLFLTECNPQKPAKTHRQRPRTIFTAKQVNALNHIYHSAHYISNSRKRSIAAELGLSADQVKVWFQNKRSQSRRSKKKTLTGSEGTVVGPDPMIFSSSSSEPSVDVYSGDSSGVSEGSSIAGPASMTSCPTEGPHYIFNPEETLCSHYTSKASNVNNWLDQQPTWYGNSGASWLDWNSLQATIPYQP